MPRIPNYYNSFDEKVRRLTLNNLPSRESRGVCGDDVVTLFSNPALAILFVLVCLVLLLLLLGLIKGLLGLYCCPPVGMCGLGALIDLPRPLKFYQESELSTYDVKYDMIGWPIHPVSLNRTVRAISLRSEFCLNVIFFLAYPVIMTITLFSLCCFHQIYDTDDSERKYRDTHTIMLTECPSIICKKTLTSPHTKCIKMKDPNIYADNDSAEEADTKYVLDQMAKSEENMK